MISADTLAGRLTRTLTLWVGSVWILCVLAVVWYVDREINEIGRASCRERV